MNQEDIAILLQGCADQGEYTGCDSLAKHCAYLGASYKVMSWLDSYCLSRNLYNTGKVKNDLTELMNEQYDLEQERIDDRGQI